MNPFLSPFKKTYLLAGLAACTLFTSCDDKDDNPTPQGPTYTVPTTYNFDNVNYSGQTNRILMLSELDSVMKTANNGAVLNSTTLTDMYANSNNAFNRQSLNTSGKQLKDKTIATAQNQFLTYFDNIAQASTSAGAPASNGTAGILTTADGKTYLVDENGVEWGQVISKGLMGAVFYNQAVDGYLTNAKIGNSVDNTTVKPGDGTAMEHHWDEAFGYFGAPKDFPSNKTGLKYWSNYSNQIDAVLNTNKTIMDAFLKGRAAISNKDMAAKDEAVATIRNEWEKLVAASTIHELRAARSNYADQAKRSHYLSEARGFAMSLGYKTDRKISVTQLADVMTKISGNYYTTSVADIDAAIDIISQAYGLDAVKGQL
ncbi:MAG: DUF4856 domain-containing protein [Hymenobacteraceae bacterium]|nr:DUF4856 domain-containing protein [Hymenobacteraceae bacterium]MDX5396235.1 DUF4856 domain-containing protein [Hymenobacteraceae bacterium]MDX5442850.1 DUF4856 domain-containing protein [Hymenobacteraceae bacterium]MDX5512298.1 DUF4856 domain-containing protein [Hymenobacteraceae bacterium]